jgi:hypothetical protein
MAPSSGQDTSLSVNRAYSVLDAAALGPCRRLPRERFRSYGTQETVLARAANMRGMWGTSDINLRSPAGLSTSPLDPVRPFAECSGHVRSRPRSHGLTADWRPFTRMRTSPTLPRRLPRVASSLDLLSAVAPALGQLDIRSAPWRPSMAPDESGDDDLGFPTFLLGSLAESLRRPISFRHFTRSSSMHP